MASPAKALADVDKANNDLLKKGYDGKAGARFVTEVKESMLFQYNWSDLLSAAPTAISLLGACHVASSSDEAAAINLSDATPAGGWKYLRVAAKPTLRAGLVFVGDQGAKAFRIAGSNMSSMSGTSGELIQTVGDIVRATQALPDTQRNLEVKLNQLRRLSDQCLGYANETEKAFDDWLLSVSEFHQASVQKHGSTEAEAEANMSSKLQAEIEVQYTKKELDKADAAAKVMKASLEKADQAFQKANNEVPTAWESCAMAAISSIAQAGPSIIAQALPALINSANPMSAVGGITSALAQAGKQGAANAPGGSEVTKAAVGMIPDKNPIMEVANATPQTDPAYSAAPLLAPFITSLLAYLTSGPDNGVDWAKFKDQSAKDAGETSSEPSTKGLTWLLTNLRMQKASAHLGTEDPSKQLNLAFDQSINLVEEIKKEVSNQLQLSSAKTDAAVIKRWQDTVTKVKETVTTLETTAKSFPGTSPNAPQLQNVKINIPKTDNSAQTAALNTATEKLAINQKALETSQANYQKAAESAAAVQKQMTAIKTKLKGLEVAGKTLERVKEILIDCIAILVELKVQIGKLKAFFQAISTMVHLVVETKVKKFDEDVSSVAKDAAKKSLLKLNDMDIETIYSSTLQIKAYFDLLHSICLMYTNIHVQHVETGLALVNELSKVSRSPEEMRPKREALDKFTDNAQKAIMKIVGDKQREISDGLEERVQNIAQQTEMLHKAGVPMPPPGIVAAMNTGGEAIQDFVEKNLPTGMRIEVNVDAGSDF